MKIPRYFASIMLLLSFMGGLPAAAGADEPTSAVRFQRTNHLVADLEKALRVYRDVLGMTLVAVRDLPADGYAYEIFQVPRSATLRFAVLATPSQSNVVALTEVKGLEAEAAHIQPHLPRSGIVLEFADFDGVIERAKREGLRVFEENLLKTSDGRMGRQQGFIDHDNNLIVAYVINERGKTR